MTYRANSSRADEAQTSIVSVFLNGYLAFREHREQRRAVAQQSALSDHALKDLGLCRFEISTLASATRSDRRRSHARD